MFHVNHMARVRTVDLTCADTRVYQETGEWQAEEKAEAVSQRVCTNGNKDVLGHKLA